MANEREEALPMGIGMRLYFSTYLLASAALSSRLAGEIEARHQGESYFDLDHRARVFSSILASVGFLEAMVNELFQNAVDDYVPPGGAITSLDENVRRLMAEYWRATEKGERVRVLHKYQALLTFAGEPAMDRGTIPYQAANDVIMLRNEIAHFRPQSVSPGKPTKMETRLRHWGFKDNRLMQESGNPWWPDKCLGYGCSQWALQSVVSL
jgi:hypothetical protein